MRRGVRDVTLKYLNSVTNSAGVTYYYLRRNGRRIALGRGPVDSPEFLAAYSKAMKDGPQPRRRAAQGTIASVCEAFRAGTTYQGYSSAYRGTVGRHMDAIATRYPDAMIKDLRPHHIRADLSKLKPHAANDRLKTWRLVCEMAYDRNWSQINAADGIKRGKLPKTDGHLPWSADQIAAYRARWEAGTVLRLAMEILYWSAARTCDAVKLTPSMIGADGVLVFTQQKTGGKAYVPWTCPLPGWAAPFERDRAQLMACLGRGFTYLETGPGKVRSAKGLSNLIAKGLKGAKIEGVSAHGLRKSRLTAIAEAGGSASAIMSWGGHKSLSEAEDYISTANRKATVIGNTSNQSDNKAG